MTTSTAKIVAKWRQNVPAPMHLSSFFMADDDSYFNTEEVEYHVDRDSEDVAIPLPNDTSGYHMNSEGGFTKKKTTPPAYKEEVVIPASSVGKTQQFGQTQYTDPGFVQEAAQRAMSMANKLSKKILRAREIQAAQILTTCKLALTDADGNTVYALDFKPKSTHFFTVTVPWSTTASADPIGDILTGCRLVRKDSLEDPMAVEMDADSFEAAMKVTSFKERFDLRRAELGAIRPLTGVGTRGAEYRGTIDVGAYKLDLYTYESYYKHWQTGASTLYLPRKKVVIHTGTGMKALYGGMFNYNQTKAPIPFLRARMPMQERGFDMFFNNWLDPNGEGLHIGVGARPLLVPEMIDGIVCFDTDLA